MESGKIASKKQRDPLADIIRGFAILLVVWGHCIQEGNGADYSLNALYFDDKLYQLIYSFHMPLFAIIAGFYAYPSIARAIDRKAQLELLRKRIIVYIIPIVVWTLFEYIRECAVNIHYGYRQITPGMIIPEFAYKLITNHWFLWSMIICFAIVWIMHFILKDNLIIYLIGFIALFFIPDGLNMHAYKFLMPFYIIAFYYHMALAEGSDCGGSRISVKEIATKINSFFVSKTVIASIITGIGFVGLFLLYDKRAFIYVSGYRITKNVWYHMLIIDIYRFVIGLVGSLFMICLWKTVTNLVKKYNFPVLQAFGRCSLGVYLLSGYITILGMRRITDTLQYSVGRNIAETIVVAIVSLLITMGIAKIPVLKKIVGK